MADRATLQTGSAPTWTPPRRSRLPALGLSMLITGGLGLMLVLALVPAREHKPTPPPLAVVIVRGAPAPPVPPAPPITPQRVVAAAAIVSPPAITIETPFRPLPPRRTRPAPPRPAPSLPSARPTPARIVNAARPLPPTQPPGDPHAIDTLEGRIRRAVQLALRYPASARDMGEQGRTLVGFDYRDSAVTDVRLLVGSGNDRLDVAALETVRDANYPPPDALAGRTLSLAVWVSFRIDGDG